MDEKKRTRRTKEEIVADIDKKIQHHKDCIVALEEKKVRVLSPKPRKKALSMKQILDYSKSQGMTLEDVAKLVGFNYEE